MTEFEESRLKFKFSDSWRILKLDKSEFYKGTVDKTSSGVKSVDFIGIHQETLYFIEVKNSKGYIGRNKEKLSNRELSIEIAKTIFDLIEQHKGEFEKILVSTITKKVNGILMGNSKSSCLEIARKIGELVKCIITATTISETEKWNNKLSVEIANIIFDWIEKNKEKNLKKITKKVTGILKDNKESLYIEIAQKVRDSIACIIAATRTSETEKWQDYKNLLCNPQIPLKIVIWLEQDFPTDPREKARKATEVKEFKAKLNWLSSHIFVESLPTYALPDVTVENLPDPPT